MHYEVWENDVMIKCAQLGNMRTGRWALDTCSDHYRCNSHTHRAVIAVNINTLL